MAFGFRLRYFAPPGICLENAARELTFSLPGGPQPLVLRHTLKEANDLPTEPEVFIIEADGFVDEETARTFGARLKTTLSVCFARHGLGFNLGEDRATSSLASSIRAELRATYGVDMRPTVHGLDVFEITLPIKHFRVRARGSVIRVLREFPESIMAEFKEWTLDQKQTLALSLYNASHNQFSQARFMSLITVVEVLATRQASSEAIIAFLCECLDNLNKAELTEPEQVVLRNGLGNLKTESISGSCKKLVQWAGGDAHLFSRCYNARSELLHNGTSSTDPDLPLRPHLLDEVVRKVLIWSVEGGLSKTAIDVGHSAS